MRSPAATVSRPCPVSPASCRRYPPSSMDSAAQGMAALSTTGFMLPAALLQMRQAAAPAAAAFLTFSVKVISPRATRAILPLRSRPR